MGEAFKTLKPESAERVLEEGVIKNYKEAVWLWEKSLKGGLGSAEIKRFKEIAANLHTTLKENPSTARRLERGEIPGGEMYKTVLFDEHGRYNGLGISILMLEARIQEMEHDIVRDFRKRSSAMIALIMPPKHVEIPAGYEQAMAAALEKNIKLIGGNIQKIGQIYTWSITMYGKLDRLMAARPDLKDAYTKLKAQIAHTISELEARRERQITRLELALAALESPDVRNMLNEINGALEKGNRPALGELQDKISALFTSRLQAIEHEMREKWAALERARSVFEMISKKPDAARRIPPKAFTALSMQYRALVDEMRKTAPWLAAELHGLLLVGGIIGRRLDAKAPQAAATKT